MQENPEQLGYWLGRAGARATWSWGADAQQDQQLQEPPGAPQLQDKL